MTHTTRKIASMLGAATLVVGLQFSFISAGANAASIVSANFTFGLGFDNTHAWTLTENAGNNSSTTQGDFTLSPVATSPVEWSSAGVAFPNRALASGSHSASISATTTGPVVQNTVTLTGSYNGPAPADASATPNYQLTIEITQLSIWVGGYAAGTGGDQVSWSETTSGHTSNSPMQTIPLLGGAGATNPAGGYAQLLWDPTDFQFALSGLNDSQIRTFINPVVGGDANNDFRFADGIEVLGRVILTYEAVPEPSGLLIVCIGLVIPLAHAWRNRK